MVARKQIAVEARAGVEQVAERQLRPQAELEGGIAELDVEIEQADFAPDASPLLSANWIASWLSSAVAPTPPTLLITLTSLPIAAARVACDGKLIADGGQRGFQIVDIERQRHNVVRAGPDQRPDERQRRLIGGGDQRGFRGRGKLLEALDGGR